MRQRWRMTGFVDTGLVVASLSADLSFSPKGTSPLIKKIVFFKIKRGGLFYEK